MAASNPHTEEGIFNDLSMRRKGLIKALTTGAAHGFSRRVGCMGAFDPRGV
jgi:hypothetical protein